MHKIKFALILAFGFFTETALANSCLQVHGALDIGSGSTKAIAASVDTCKKTIVKVLYEDQRKISFNEALEKSESGEIPQALVNDAKAIIEELVGALQKQKAQKITGIATSAFRVAKNGTQVAQTISEAIRVPIEVISQEKEAEFGFWSALAAKGISPKELDQTIVWDIGGGSMQMFAVQKNRTKIFQGDLASVSFKNLIISRLQKKDPKTHPSPNPLNEYSAEAVKLAREHAKASVPEFFLTAKNKYRWIGVGGVHAFSVQDQVNPKATKYTRSELTKSFKERSKLNDSEIESEYRTTEVSNLALVLGYMEALELKEVETARVSLTQGLLLYSLANVSP